MMSRFINEEQLLYCLNGTDHTGRRAWYYLMVHPYKLAEFKRKLLVGSLTFSDYGEVVASGYGDAAPPHVREQLQARFGKKLTA